MSHSTRKHHTVYKLPLLEGCTYDRSAEIRGADLENTTRMPLNRIHCLNHHYPLPASDFSIIHMALSSTPTTSSSLKPTHTHTQRPIHTNASSTSAPPATVIFKSSILTRPQNPHHATRTPIKPNSPVTEIHGVKILVLKHPHHNACHRHPDQ